MGEEREEEVAEELIAEERAVRRSICWRVASISFSYCTPEGQAVTQAMQPRQRSMWRVKSGVIPISPSEASFIR